MPKADVSDQKEGESAGRTSSACHCQCHPGLQALAEGLQLLQRKWSWRLGHAKLRLGHDRLGLQALALVAPLAALDLGPLQQHAH